MIETTEDHVKALEVIKKDLMEATNVTLQLPKPGLQNVILCDASYHGAGFVLMMEDYVNETGKKEKKTYALVSSGSHLFNATQLNFSIYYKEFLALYYALDYISHYILGSSKQVIILTDNKSLTQFFQSKVLPPSLWNCLDRILAFNIVIAHIPGRANYAADFLSRMENDKTATLSLKLTDRIPVREIEIDTEAQNPDIEMNALFDEHQALGNQVTDEILQQLKTLGLYGEYKKKHLNNELNEIQGLIKLKRKQEINLIEYPNPLDEFPDLTDNLISLNLADEQQKDTDIRTVINWLQQNNQQCLASGNCTQFMDDIGNAVTNFEQLVPSLREIFICIRHSGLKLSPEKCEIATDTMKFLGNNISAEGISPEKAKITKFLDKFKMPKTTKQVKRLIGFTQFFRNYIPNLGEKLMSFYKLLQ